MRRLLPTLALACLALAQDSEMYYVVFLRPDPGRTKLEQAEAQKIQDAHMANIGKMAADGVLVSAGPFGDQPPTISGIFIMKAASRAEAQRVAAADPTVVNHRNSVDVHAWRGPAGIGAEYFKLHREKPDTPENMGVHPLAILLRGSQGDSSKLAAHREYIARLRREGKLAAAGPIEDDDAMAGIVVFRRIPLEEARTLIEADPAISAGVLRAELHRWWSADHVLPW